MATYNELVDMVRDWANRDVSVLPDSIIQSCLRYTADEAYRTLEIPPLEHTRYFITKDVDKTLTLCFKTGEGTYSTTTQADVKTADYEKANNTINSNVSFSVPPDTVSFIYLRTSGIIERPEIGSLVGGIAVTEDNYENFAIVNSLGKPSVTPLSGYRDTVYDERTDVKTFYDFNDADRYSNYFTRKGGSIIAAGNEAVGNVFELFYYRRLPALNARNILPSTLTLLEAQSDTTTYQVITSTQYDSLTELAQRTYDLVETHYVRYTLEVSNWLRDHNERVLLFGALHRVFDFLQVEDQAAKYRARFIESITELNTEEKKRKMSAGHTTISFGNTNLI